MLVSLLPTVPQSARNASEEPQTQTPTQPHHVPVVSTANTLAMKQLHARTAQHGSVLAQLQPHVSELSFAS